MKTSNFCLQAVDVKVYTEAENKKNIKQRIILSDGISKVVSMITDRVDSQLVSTLRGALFLFSKWSGGLSRVKADP